LPNLRELETARSLGDSRKVTDIEMVSRGFYTRTTLISPEIRLGIMTVQR
jgi:hypothetical protein